MKTSMPFAALASATPSSQRRPQPLDASHGSSPHPQGGKKTLKLPFMLVALVALASSLASHAATGATESAAAQVLPFKGTLEGRHASRTPLAPPFVFDRFEAKGQATQLGQFALVIEATVNFGARPVTGAGTYTFTAANGDRLVADHTGFSALVEPGIVLITEHAVIDPGRSTGRFAGATGSFTVGRFADAATGVGGLTVGTFEGTISIPGSPPTD
jgi:hypothetical protein